MTTAEEWTQILVDTRKKALDLANRVGRFEFVGLDTESSGPLLVGLRGKKSMINMYRASLTGMSLATADKRSYYIPLAHRQGNLDLHTWKCNLEPAILDIQTAVCHNVKHELQSWEGRPKYLDTLVMMWLLQKDAGGSYGLKQLAAQFLDKEMSTFDDTTGGFDFSQLKPKEGLSYACEDAEVALELHQKFWPSLKTHGLETHFWDVEMRFVHVLRAMEDRGFAIDHEELERIVYEFTQEQNKLLEAWEFMAPGVNINSPQQLAQFYRDAVWDGREVPTGKSGDKSTGKEYLQWQLERCAPGTLGYNLAKVKLEYATYKKLTSTYGHKLVAFAHQHPDYRLHCSYHHTGTATGRLSSSTPNLQNIPTRTPQGKRIRDAFVSAEGKRLLSADYSQIELRVLAHLAGRGALYDGYRAGADVHQAVADDLDVTRDQGKTANFATVYGAGAKKLARALGMDPTDAKRFLDRFKESRVDEMQVLERFKQVGATYGMVRTLLGRFRYVDIAEKQAMLDVLKEEGHRYNSSEEYRKAWLELGSEERKAGNTPIQGGASDIVKLAMIDAHEAGIPLIAQVHDDLICEVDERRTEECAHALRECMENAYELAVPLIAEPVWGKKWSDLK